jgi:hypothetical protein
LEIIGTIIKEGNSRAFAFDIENGTIEFDVFKPTWEKSCLNPIQQAEYLEAIRNLTPFDEIRFDEYFCGVCKDWFDSTKQEWSVGICLSCSLDRGSELSEIFD